MKQTGEQVKNEKTTLFTPINTGPGMTGTFQGTFSENYGMNTYNQDVVAISKLLLHT